MHALIIEDDFLIATQIENVLRDCGFNSFDMAHSGEEAVTAANAKFPDLITSDVQLNPGCGIATVQTIRRGPSVPVIFISGSAANVRLLLPGQAVLDKPFSGAMLMAAVAVAMKPN